jgi:hypothetical protein
MDGAYHRLNGTIPMNKRMFNFSEIQRRVVPRYLAWTGIANFLWEILQLPLYTLWKDDRLPAIAYAVVHCTGGDVLIAASCLALAMLVCGARQWPSESYWTVAGLAVVLGLAYTVFSEWNNTVIARTWAYSTLMPTFWGIGLSPIAQWLLIPSVVFWRLSHQIAPTLPPATHPVP